MRLIALVAAVFLCLVNSSHAQTSVQWSFSTEAYSKYISGSLGFVLYDRPVVQTNINASFTGGMLNGMYVNIWHSGGLEGNRPAPNMIQEIDWTVGWAGSIGAAGLNASCSYYDLHRLFRAVGDIGVCSLEINTSFKSAAHTVTPFVLAEYVMPENTNSGVWLRVGARHLWRVHERLSFGHAGAFMYDSGAINIASGYSYAHQAALTWHLTKQFDVRLPIVKFHAPVTNFNDGRKPDVAFGAGIGYRF